LTDPCLPDLFIENYPAMPGVIMMAAVFVLFLIEMWLNAKTGGHSHGGAKGEGLVGGATPPGVSEVIRHPIGQPIGQVRRQSFDSQETMAFRDEKKNWVSET
jgi:solute carrier family 39 (zinc transporter), member 1/2/3